MYALRHENGDAVFFSPIGNDTVEIVEIISGEADPPAEFDTDTARALWKVFVRDGFHRDQDAEVDPTESEQRAEAYNDARVFGYGHSDALTSAWCR